MKGVPNVMASTDYAMTHAAIAEQLGDIGATGVQQLEKRAMIKVRHICERRGIRFADLMDQLKIGPAREMVE